MKKLLSCLFAALFVLSSCNKDDVIEVDSQTAPRITLDSENAVYTIKSGRELTISPAYENADKALYVWKIDGKVVGTEPALTVCEQTAGELFVLLQVSNRYGTASEELRVDVVELEIPTISLPVPEKGYTILVGSPLTLKPSVIDTSIPTTCTWSVNGKEVSSEKEFTFDASKPENIRSNSLPAMKTAKTVKSSRSRSARSMKCLSAGRLTRKFSICPRDVAYA